MINKNQSKSERTIENVNFIDKLISYHGFLKMLLFFSIQTIVLVIQLMTVTNQVDLTTANFWEYNIAIVTQIFLNYLVFALILLLIFSFNLGKEAKMKRKERAVLFTFKTFLFLTTFLIFNGFIIFDYAYLYYYAHFNSNILITAPFFFKGSLIVIEGIWIINFIGYFFIKIISHFTKTKSKSLNTETAAELIHQSQSPEHTISLQNIFPSTNSQPENFKQTSSVESSNSNTSKANETLTKKEIIQMQLTQQKQVEQQRKNQMQQQTKMIPNNEDSTQKPEETKPKNVKPATPRFIFSFLEKNFFVLDKFEQTLVFFTLSQFTWLILFSANLFNETRSLALINTNQQALHLLTNFSILEVCFYVIVSFFYYDILKNDFKLSKDSIRNNVSGFLGIGFTIVLISLIVASINNGDWMFYYILLKFLIVLLIPLFYFGYKNQNEPNSDGNKLTKINPVFRYFYNKSLDELRSNEKSADIIKKFLQTHKEDIKNSLLTATPVNFKENIRTVILKDYERLETLLKYNNILIKSKVATIDYTMEIFSTFLINVEVNLQDVYTEHLLTANQENLLKPISPDFIESKFSKLFSQWESLDWSTH